MNLFPVTRLEQKCCVLEFERDGTSQGQWVRGQGHIENSISQVHQPKQRAPPPSSPGPMPPNFNPMWDGTSTHPILHKISIKWYSLTSASVGIDFYFRIYSRSYKARRDSFSKDKTMMYLRCNTCPKEPCKWRAKIRLLRPHLLIEDPEYMAISNYLVLPNSKAHHHHITCRSLSLPDTELDGNPDGGGDTLPKYPL